MRDFFKNWRRKAAVATLVIACVAIIAIDEFRLAWIKEDAKLKVRIKVTDIADLMNQYCNQRIVMGTWPDAKQLYATCFHLQSSTQTENGRLDVFTDQGNYADPLWASIELRNDGHFYVNVKNKPPESP